MKKTCGMFQSSHAYSTMCTAAGSNHNLADAATHCVLIQSKYKNLDPPNDPEKWDKLCITD